jgi:hypothetical protein
MPLSRFQPSEALPQPYLMVGVQVIAAETAQRSPKQTRCGTTRNFSTSTMHTTAQEGRDAGSPSVL